jgi:O-antigen/teichoic acid export membrane protein
VTRLLSSAVVRQTLLYTGGSLIASLLALVATAIVSRHLSTDAFGSYSFAVATYLFVALFFGFGIYPAAARLTALAHGRDARTVVGSALVLYVPVGVLYVGSMVGLSFLMARYIGVADGPALFAGALLGLGYPFFNAAQLLAQGENRLQVSAYGSVVFQALFIVMLLAIVSAGTLSDTSATVLRSVALMLASIVVAVLLRPVFADVRSTVGRIFHDSREYGFNVYLGRLLSIGTYNMDVVLVGIWAPSRDVGFYALATALAAAVGLPISALGQSLFARLAGESQIDRRLILFTWLGGAGLAAVALLVAKPLISLVFSDRYVAAYPFLVPLLVATVIRGVTGLYISFLSAHGRGREMRNAALILTACNLMFNFTLIPAFGAMGAALASLAALSVNLCGYLFYYHRSLPRIVAA